MTEQIKLLNQIKSNQATRTMIEEFIKEKSSVFDYCYSSIEQRDNYYNDFIDKYISFSKDLSQKLSIDIKIFFLYLSLDYRCCSYLMDRHVDRFKINFVFKEKMFRSPELFFEFNDLMFDRVYKENHKGIVRFLSQSFSMFPNSSQEFILAKIEQSQYYKEQTSISRILNNFEFKVFINILSPDFNFEQISIIFKKFRNIGNAENKTLTMLYFYLAINLKYPNVNDCETEQIVRVKNNIINEIPLNFKLLEQVKLDNNILNLLRKEVCLSNLLFSLIDKGDYDKRSCFFVFMSVFKDDKKIELIDNYLKEVLILESRKKLPSFEKYGKDLQNTILAEYKKQIFDHYPFLIDETSDESVGLLGSV